MLGKGNDDPINSKRAESKQITNLAADLRQTIEISQWMNVLCQQRRGCNQANKPLKMHQPVEPMPHK